MLSPYRRLVLYGSLPEYLRLGTLTIVWQLWQLHGPYAAAAHSRGPWGSAPNMFSAPIRLVDTSPKQRRVRLPDVCMICAAAPAPFVCPCKTRRYCSPRCQKCDWNRCGHKHACPQEAGSVEDKM